MIGNQDYWPTNRWRYANLNDIGMKKEYFKNLEYSINSQYKNINSFIIVKKGYIAYERYFNGYIETDTHNVASVTKSVISALIGIAIDKGYINSVDQKVIDFFPDYASMLNGTIRNMITVKHLLTMTAPFPWKYESLDRLRRQKNWTRYIISQLGSNGHIGMFRYSTSGTHLLSIILTRATGMQAREFANKYLFNNIGIQEIPDYNMNSYSLEDVFGKNAKGWIKDPQGNTVGGFGLKITAKDMARFGLLYLNYGVWDGKQIVSKKWIKDSLTMNSNKYGYLWWLIDEKNIKGYTAAGSGGNHIFCFPDKELVVAIASKITMKPKERLPLIVKYILPSI
ncbi:serine hydrolase [Clostridiaceae bacterium M8S5]|nr:serine hydrolase [Clostridiaceae bacterium M8S5]